MKTICIIGGWGDNYGDRVLQKSNADLLSKTFPNSRFTYINSQRTYFSKHLIDYLNNSADMLFIAGGGFIFNRPQDKSVSGWQWNINAEDISRIEIPLVVNAIGYNKFPKDTHNFDQSMWENLQVAIDHSDLFSVRNAGTHETMTSNGIDTTRVEVTPDCGMFINRRVFNHDIFDKEFKVGFNWASDRMEQRFSGNWQDKLLDVLSWLKTLQDTTIYFVEHLMPNTKNRLIKEKIYEIVKKELGNNCIILREGLGNLLYPMFDYTAPFFADIYAQMDLVVGMRGHSMIVPFGVETPMIGIGAHNKIGWFLEDVGLKKFWVGLEKDSKTNIMELDTCFNSIFDNLDEHKMLMRQNKNIQMEKKEEWFNKVKNLL